MAWFYSTNEELWCGDVATREEAISAGRRDHAAGAPFKIAEGRHKGPWPRLFDSVGDLREFIDNANEDNAFEEAFTEEANLSDAAFTEMLAEINQSYDRWLKRHQPISNALDLGATEDIPATAEWLERVEQKRRADGL